MAVFQEHTWEVREPITQEKMNRIEKGITEALTDTANNATSIATVSNTVSGMTNTINSVNATAELAKTTANTALDRTEAGNKAWTYVSGAMTFNPETNEVITNLASRFDTDESAIQSVTSNFNNFFTNELVPARGQLIHTGNSANASNLKQKLDDMDTQINLNKGSITTNQTDYNNAKGTFNTLQARLNDIDGNPESPSGIAGGRIGALEAEIADARNGQTDLDTRITADETAIGNLQTDKVNVTDIVDNLNQTDTNKPLSAKQGNVIKQMFGTGVGTTTGTTVAELINTAQTNATSNAEAYTDGLLGTGFDTTNTVAKAIDDLETAVGTADDALDGRLDSVEDELTNARTSSVIKETVTEEEDGETVEHLVDKTYDSVDARLEAIESNAAAIRNDVTIIAGELSMIDGAAIVNTNTRIDTLASSLSTAEGNITTLQNTVNDATTGLAATKTIADGAAEVASGLATRVTALENNPTSSTVVMDDVTYNASGKPVITSPSPDIDYLLEQDGQYYYWKYIDNDWELISGGGSGTSSAEFYADFPQDPSDTVDYFIGSGTNYIHYRWYNNAWVQILPTHLINNVTVDTTPISGEDNSPTKSRPIIKEIGSNTNLLAAFNAIQSIGYTQDENGTTLTWIDIDGSADGVTITGGGGGSGSSANATITRVTNGNLTTITGETCEISFKFYATDSSGDALATTSTGNWSINRAQVATSTVYVNNPADDDDYNTFDITQYLRNGENNITLTVNTTVDDQVISRTKTWSITVVNFSLTWNYDESTINDGNTIDFSCTPYGIDITKTLHIKVGNYEQTQTVTTSGIPVTVSLTNNFNHGTYTAEMWMTATINGEAATTNHIFHDFLVVESGNTTPIIAATLPSSAIDQYNTISIPFVVYTPNSNTSTISLADNGTVVDTRDVGRTTQTWHYTPTTLGVDIIEDENEVPISGTHVLTITTGSVTKTLTLTVRNIQINNTEIGGYAFKLKASELPSNNALQNWHYDDNDVNNTKLQFSNNFDWVNGGIKTEYDENDQLRQYIRIKSGTTMTIPYQMFATDPRTNGANFKIIFKIDNCRNYDATVATNIADDIGIQLNAHGATFQSTTTQINTQYGEEEYTELEFEVYKSLLPNGTDAPNQYMMAWIDGVIATARAYGGNFVQADPVNFVIGSTECDVCVYLVKYYPTVLSRNDHISNFIADAPNAVEMMQRYNRNDILDADEDIDYEKVAQKNPDCRVWLYDISRMTKSKDDSIDVYNFQQIWEGGDQYYQLTGTNAKLKIQGTSSVNYRYGAANTDIDFRTSKAPDATLVDGYGNNLLSNDLAVKGFKINDNSVPIEYSNTKVNFASCEQVNNMCNAEWYQRYQPFPSLSARDCMEFAMGVQFIKDRHEDEPSDGIPLFTEKGADFNPEKYYMYSIANMGTSKKNTHIFHSENECCIEIKENTSDAQKMKSFDSAWTDTDKNTQNYEMRYPDIKPTQVPNDIRTGWARFVNWMVANNPGAATNAALAEEVTFEPYTFRGHNRTVTETTGRHFEQVLRGTTVSQYAGTYDHDTFEYRMAKMLSECEDYMAMDSVIYHFCFIERHTMVDNVAKNTFWSSVKEVGGPNDESGYWIWDLSKNYDNDTSDGNNNNGLLVFDYGNEASDTRDGTPVFNGYDAVWFIFASNLYEACQTMFTNREAIGAWNSVTYHNYLLNEQRKVPERIWNECYWYDYLRTYENNVETTWINFLDGGQKTHQRKHYETYEEIYDSSKYRGSFSHNQSITLRGEAIDYQTLGLPAQESKFTITMFNKCYLTIWIGTNYQTVKCTKGVPVTLYFYEDNDPSKGYMSLANSVIDIDSGSMVQAIGDLSLIYPSSGQFGAAKRLRSLQIGSDTTGYYNPNMNNNSVLTFNNKMLEYLYVQNLPQATYNLDLSNCPELKFLKASGSGFTGFVFANGGLLNEVYVNAPTSLVMRNLNSLTKANFHLTDPTAVTSLRLENCSLFDNYSFINELTNLNVLRLTNINWTLNSNGLLDRLVTLMGINEIGSTVSQSYLSGNVALTGIVYEGDYDKYTDAWSPDLVIDVTHASQFVSQHLVIYKNEDGTELYRRYISHGDDLIDPYYSNLIEIPTKAADVQNRYVFGEVDFAANYKKYSGWRLSTDEESITATYGDNPSITVNGAMELFAVFSATPQQYTVRWLLRDNVVVTSTPSPQNYGSGYDLASPTIKEVQALGHSTYTFSYSGSTCSYSIMTGWNKLPTNITPTEVGVTYDIMATWLERTNVNYNDVLASNDYSVEEKLLVLKNIPAARNSLHLADRFPVTLGYDGIKPAINLVSSPRRFNGTAEVTSYEPFSANKSFTLMIDYRFEYAASNYNEAILLSCYDESNNSTQGFKLYYKPNAEASSLTPVPQISFGSTASSSSTNVQVIGSSMNNRGIVVLRHRAGDSLLYVYTGATSNGLTTTYSPGEFRKAITWSGLTSNAKIVLGGCNVANSSWTNATGTLYSVKYWEEDLGEGECAQLASWCHETTYFAAQDWNGYGQHSAINSTLTANLVLHALNASEMGTITEAALSQSMTTIGWDPSTVREFYNNRLYYALPIKLQSIITPATIPHIKAIYENNQFVISTQSTTTTDYVFAPSWVETGAEGTDLTTHSAEAAGAFAWFNSNQMYIRTYTEGDLSTSQVTFNADYTNLRFPYSYNPVNSSVTIYYNYPSTGTSFYTWINAKGITLKTGDILVPSNGTVAYMYVDATEINKGAPYATNTDSYLSNTVGGWIPSTKWWTRSVPQAMAPNANYSKFIYMNQLGQAKTGGSNSRYNVGLVYSIAL